MFGFNNNNKQSSFGFHGSIGESNLFDSSPITDNEVGGKHFDSFPPGHRFKPTDEELILHYLINKLYGKSLPPNRIREVDFYKHSPQELAARYKMHQEKEMYFFSPRMRKYINGDRPNRTAADGSGYWKATNAPRAIKSPDGEATIGTKTRLVFFQGNHPEGAKTNWILYEYMATNDPTKFLNSKDDNEMLLDFCVLYKLYDVTRKGHSKDGVTCNNDPNHNDQFKISGRQQGKRKTTFPIPEGGYDINFQTLNQYDCHFQFTPQDNHPEMHGENKNPYVMESFNALSYFRPLQTSPISQPEGFPCYYFLSQDHACPCLCQQVPYNATAQLVEQQVNMMQQSPPSLPQSPSTEKNLERESYLAPSFQEDYGLSVLDGASYQVEDNISTDSNEYFDASFLFQDPQEP